MKNTRKRLQRNLRHQIEENFDEEQAFLNIEAQLSGTAVREESEDESFLEDTMHTLQLHLVQSLLSYPISNSLDDEGNRRDTGAGSVVEYCSVLEGVHSGADLSGTHLDPLHRLASLISRKIQGRPKMMPTHVRYLFLSLASRHVLPKNTLRILRSQRLAFNALQTRGSLNVFASRCIMTLDALRAIFSAMHLMCIMCAVASVARIRYRTFKDKNEQAMIS